MVVSIRQFLNKQLPPQPCYHRVRLPARHGQIPGKSDLVASGLRQPGQPGRASGPRQPGQPGSRPRGLRPAGPSRARAAGRSMSLWRRVFEQPYCIEMHEFHFVLIFACRIFRATSIFKPFHRCGFDFACVGVWFVSLIFKEIKQATRHANAIRAIQSHKH